MLVVVRCLLLVVCCLYWLCVASFMFVGCRSSLLDVRCLLFVVWRLVFVVCCLLYVV